MRALLMLGCLCLPFLGSADRLCAQDKALLASQEHLIKAAYLYNFAMFVEWPPETFSHPDSPIVIGILGKDAIHEALDRAVKDKKINGRGFLVKRVQGGPDVRDCHILFIAASEEAKTAEVVASLKGLPILVVGETPGFAKQGGIVNFALEDSRVRCEINIIAAKNVGLRISSKLLNISKIIAG